MERLRRTRRAPPATAKCTGYDGAGGTTSDEPATRAVTALTCTSAR